MPRWIGNEPSRQPDDPRMAKVAADLALLHAAARTAFASLRDLGAGPPSWMPADVRMRVAGVQHLCELVTAQAQQLGELLEVRGDPREN